MENPEFTIIEAQRSIKWIQQSPACSFWLKDALKTSLKRDPVDAWKDASLLASILSSVATKHPLV